MNKEIIPVNPEEIPLARSPEEEVERGRAAAVALKKVIGGKKNPVIFKGEQYLEFEDWQTLARFYGFTVGVEWTRPIEIAGVAGWEARAVAYDRSGQIVSSAEAMCLRDEPNWENKPLFQLRSMAQTRACAKALRNLLAWVAVLAGYRPTPAEEIIETPEYQVKAPEVKETKEEEGIFVTKSQIACIHTIAQKLKIDLESFYRDLGFPPKTTSLTRNQASIAIEKLKEMERNASGA